MPTQRIPLVGSLLRRGLSWSTNYGKDQKFENCFPEVTRNSITGQGSVYLVKRPGFTTSAIGPTGYVGANAGCVWKGAATNPGKSVFAFYKAATSGIAICDYAGTQLGSDMTSYIGCYSLTETMISGVSNLVAMNMISASGLREAWFFPEGGAWTKIASNFPSNLGTPVIVAGEPVHLDGYMFVIGVNGRIYNSDLNNLATWTSTSWIDAQQSPDGGCGLVKYKNMVVALGTSSIEFFQNSGNATGSPLSRVQLISNVGCIPTVNNNASLAPTVSIGDTFYWIGQDSSDGTRRVYRMNGMTPEVVSTSAIDRMINRTGNAAYTLLGASVMHGMSHLILSNGAYGYDDYAYPAFCIDTKTWWIFRPGVSIIITKFVPSSWTAASFITNTNNKRYITDLDGSTYQDDSTNYALVMQTQLLDHGTNNLKEFVSVRLTADTQTTSGNATLQWSDNDFVSFSTAKNIDMTQEQKKVDAGLGWGRRRSWKLSETVARPFRAQFLDVEYTVAEE